MRSARESLQMSSNHLSDYLPFICLLPMHHVVMDDANQTTSNGHRLLRLHSGHGHLPPGLSAAGQRQHLTTEGGALWGQVEGRENFEDSRRRISIGMPCNRGEMLSCRGWLGTDRFQSIGSYTCTCIMYFFSSPQENLRPYIPASASGAW